MINWQAKTLSSQLNPLPPTLPPTPPFHSLDQPPVLLNPPDSPNLQPKRRLPQILSIRQINSKRNKLLLFMIGDVTSYKKSLTAAINVDLDFMLDDISFESVSTTITTPAPIPFEYAEFTDVFKDKEIPQLPSHHPGVDHEIPLALGSKQFYGPIYNLSETELRYLKEYIDRMLERGWIRPSKSPFGSSILFVKQSDCKGRVKDDGN